MENQDKVNLLLARLETLMQKHNAFSREISELREEINQLKASQEEPTIDEPESAITPEYIIEPEIKISGIPVFPEQNINKPPADFTRKDKKSPTPKSDIEKFIGENLINKIGIGITVIGVAIGAKYAIDHQLISPLTRIILGYLVGLGLLVFAIRLKKKYENFSSVLLSGSMAIMYFITYSAYGFYQLIPQGFAFLLMVIFTAFTVFAAINYNRQVIAHIGLVGAYGVPFLLSEGSGKIAILFSYMSIINIGILVIAFKKYWKPLYYSSFLLTWLMYFLWYVSRYETAQHFELALIFSSAFFTIFYLLFLAYKLIQNEQLEISDALLLVNSFIYYGIGYSILNDHENGAQFVGLFTLCNAIVHFVASIVVYKKKLADRKLLYLISGLVLVFISITIPVQLDGNWVTFLWAGEAALMFWIGRTKNVAVYERLSHALMALAFLSILHDWTTVYDGFIPSLPGTKIIPIFNLNFLTSLLFISCFGFMYVVERNKKYSSVLISKKGMIKIISFGIPAILLFVIYYSLRMEIATYWNQLYAASEINVMKEGQDYADYYRMNYDYLKYKTIWIINYSLLFLSALSLVNMKKIKSQQLSFINLILNIIAIGVFLLLGLYTLSELRESYLNQTLAEYYYRGPFNIGIRYVSYAFVSVALLSCYNYSRQEQLKSNFFMFFDFLLHGSVLWIASSELINLMDIAESRQSYKFGLSILWGTYALLLIIIGIWKKKKHLRIGAIVLFGVTLIKLFFYDISNLTTIAKTIVFVLLGVLLLIVSFLYNKYKHIISDEP